MKTFGLFWLAFLTGLAPAKAQKLQLAPQSDLQLQADRFAGYDKFGFYYAIRDNAFYKFSGAKSIDYKNVSLGKISRADLQNPLRLVLFYEAFNTAVLLDNQLSETQKISFSEADPAIAVAAAGMASQNRLWLYDSLSQRIGLWDYLKNTYILITPPLQGSLKQYGSDFNYFQWIDDQNNWWACDTFGKIARIGKVPAFDAAWLSDNQLVFAKDRKLYLLDAKSGQTYPLEILDKTFESFFIKEQILTIFTGRSITNYKITIP